jgi:hypothetical protein
VAVADKQKFSSPSQKWPALAFGAFVAFIWAAQAFRPSVAPDTGSKVAFIGLAVMSFATMGWIAFRPVLITESTGIVVRNIFSTTHLSWGEIAGFRIGRYKLMGAVCLIEMRDGSSTYAFAIQVPNIARGRPETRESRMVDELNAQLAQSTGPVENLPATRSPS